MGGALDSFHPTIKEWFLSEVGEPSLPQSLGWPETKAKRNVLISAPTGSGKTLAAFLESIDQLLKLSLEGKMPQGVFVLYVSPLKALNNDIHKNLDLPLEGIKKRCEAAGIAFPEIKKAVRTGDTPESERQRMIKNPPHILITTPESLYLMLTSRKALNMLRNVRYVIVDEIHTMLGTKRGVHLALSIARLQHLVEHELVRVGLSATVNPLDEAAHYLGGTAERPVTIVSPHMERQKDLTIRMPVADYRVLEQDTIWPEIYESVLQLIQEHTATIVFVNNRAVAERLAVNVNMLAGGELCRPHHGSMSKAVRLAVEDGFKRGEIKCVVATSTLELGIDIGSVDLVVQVAAPLSVSSGVQRLGRSGHRLSATSKGRIIPRTRADLVKSAFISREMLAGRVERERAPQNCLDVLAQHIVSMSCERQWDCEEMLQVVRSAWSYRALKRRDLEGVLAMLAGDFEHREDIPARPRVYWDRKSHTIEGTPYSRILAVSSSGTIPDRGYYSVVLEDGKTRIGELDEVFVYESRIGDRFMLGNSAWKINRIERDRVAVSPVSASGAKTPFWQGDGIGVRFEQAMAYGALLREMSARLDSPELIPYLTKNTALDETGALNVKNYLLDQREAVGTISNDHRIVCEYLSDDVSDQRIIIHAHFGGRVNAVIALLLQKAIEERLHTQVFTSHSDDAVLIHVYGKPLHDRVLWLLEPGEVERTLVQMLPATSRFAMTFRYNAYRAMMMGVRNLGQRLPLWIQRLRSVDTLESALRHMDHPLVVETMRDCLEEAFDIPDTVKVLNAIRSGEIEVVERDTWMPSPFASELLFEFKGVMMYQETAPHPGTTTGPAISSMEVLDLSYTVDAGDALLDPQAVREVAERMGANKRLAEISSAAELHSFLLVYGDLLDEEVPDGAPRQWLRQLLAKGQVIALVRQDRPRLYIAAEEFELYTRAFELLPSTGNATLVLEGEWDKSDEWTPASAQDRIVRRHARYHSPLSLDTLDARYGLGAGKSLSILQKLSSEGLVRPTRFDASSRGEWCHTRVYDAITRRSSAMRAAAVTPHSARAYAAFLPAWQNVNSSRPDQEELLKDVIRQLEGLYLPAQNWESIVFPARIAGYRPALLDRLCAQGAVFWRVMAGQAEGTIFLAWFAADARLEGDLEPVDLKEDERLVLDVLLQRGACFTHVLASATGQKSSSLLLTLESLVRKGLVTNDSFSSIRFLLEKDDLKTPEQKAKRIALSISRMEMGRWEAASPVSLGDARLLADRWLRRYGLVSREVLEEEKPQIPWAAIYEEMKQREHTGGVLRGYFVEGVSGVQFMLPDAYRQLGGQESITVLNACDPAQAYGRVVPHSASGMEFTNLPGTAVVMDAGAPILVFEKYGERVFIALDSPRIAQALAEFRDTFFAGRIFPGKRRVSVKEWPEDKGKENAMKALLAATGFEMTVQGMVFRR